MLEGLWVVGTIVFIVLSLALGELMSFEMLLRVCAVTTLSGLLIGVPAGIAYHLSLRRALQAAGQLRARWWMNPTALHPLLSPAARGGLQPWFLLGAAGFVLALGACLVLSIALMVAFRQL